MNTGVWVWPADPRGQRRALRKVAADPHLMTAQTAIAKSKEGLSNAELDDAMGDNSEWITVWSVRQLTSLGFIEYKVDLFGGPARYQTTDLGRNAISTITGQPAPRPPSPPPASAVQAPAPKPVVPTPPTPQPATPKA